MLNPEIKIILTDIEGTTSAIDFVHQVLFPYSKIQLASYLQRNIKNEEVQEVIKATTNKETIDAGSIQEAITILEQWITEDRKIKPLKDLQGLIWEDGYKQGAFQGHIYDDAYEVLENWHQNSTPLYIYSSGSVKAQKLLFGHTKFGDLNYLFTGNFDTSIGGKKDPESYTKIAAEINIKANKILFLSDNIYELEAAKQAGLLCILVARDTPQDSCDFDQVQNFYQIQELCEPSCN